MGQMRHLVVTQGSSFSNLKFNDNYEICLFLLSFNIRKTAADGTIIHRVYIDPQMCHDMMVVEAIFGGIQETPQMTLGTTG